MTLEEKTSFWLEKGIHFKTEVDLKRGKKKESYKIHTYEVLRNKITERYITEAYENNKLLGKYNPLVGPGQTDKDKLIRALDTHFNCIIEYLRKGEIDKFKETFTKLPKVSTVIIMSKRITEV